MSMKMRCIQCKEILRIFGVYRKQGGARSYTRKWIGVYVCKNNHEAEHPCAGWQPHLKLLSMPSAETIEIKDKL
jgi:hypothetical protein